MWTQKGESPLYIVIDLIIKNTNNNININYKL